MTRTLTTTTNPKALRNVRRILYPARAAHVLLELYEGVSDDIQEVKNALLGLDSVRRGEQDGARQRKST